jgi:hypothetical protein
MAMPSNNELVLSTRAVPSDHEMMVYNTMAKQAVESKMYRGVGDQAGVMMIMLAARELGIPPMQALNGGLNIISGKVEISARMMSALIRKAGHQISVKESTDSLCTVIGKRGDTGETITATFTFVEAQRAGLVKAGGGWTKWPKDMCYARALSRLARQLFADVIGIGYVEGEIKATEAEIVLPEEEQVIENEEEWINKFLELFAEDDKPFALQYLTTVQEHFSWSRIQAIKELMKDDKRLFDKFSQWKNKHKKVEAK